jgi:hypothetical protein
MSDNFNDSLDFLDEVLPNQAKEKRRSGSAKKADAFSTGLESVSYNQAARATSSKSMAGQYKRYTVYLSPEDIATFRDIAADIGLSQAETGRWFFQHMFALYENGLRPKTEPVVVKRRLVQNK